MKFNISEKQLENFFRNKCSEKEEKMIKDWFLHDGKSVEAEKMLYEAWKKIDSNIDERKVNNAFSRFQQQVRFLSEKSDTKKRRVLSHRIKVYRIAAVILFPVLSLLTAYLYYSYKSTQLNIIEHNIPFGKTVEILLPDGSTAWINSGSKVYYQNKFIGEKRIIFLTGEAAFKVKKDKNRPFIIISNGIKTTALGTFFNVKAYHSDNMVVVTLEEGSVSIEDESNEIIGNNIILTKGKQAIVDLEKHAFSVQNVDTKQFTSWRNGELIFSESPFTEIMESIERKFDVKCFYNPVEFSDYRLTTKFTENDSFDQIMTVIEKTGNIKYERIKNDIYVKKK